MGCELCGQGGILGEKLGGGGRNSEGLGAVGAVGVMRVVGTVGMVGVVRAMGVVRVVGGE